MSGSQGSAASASSASSAARAPVPDLLAGGAGGRAGLPLGVLGLRELRLEPVDLLGAAVGLLGRGVRGRLGLVERGPGLVAGLGEGGATFRGGLPPALGDLVLRRRPALRRRAASRPPASPRGRRPRPAPHPSRPDPRTRRRPRPPPGARRGPASPTPRSPSAACRVWATSFRRRLGRRVPGLAGQRRPAADERVDRRAPPGREVAQRGAVPLVLRGAQRVAEVEQRLDRVRVVAGEEVHDPGGPGGLAQRPDRGRRAAGPWPPGPA